MGRGAGQVVYFLDPLKFDVEVLDIGQIVQIQRLIDIMFYKLKLGVVVQVMNVLFVAGAEIVNTDYFGCFDKNIAEVRTNKAGTAGYQDIVTFKYGSFWHRLSLFFTPILYDFQVFSATWEKRCWMVREMSRNGWQ